MGVKKAYQAPTVVHLTGREEEAGVVVGIGIGAVWAWAIVAGPVWV